MYIYVCMAVALFNDPKLVFEAQTQSKSKKARENSKRIWATIDTCWDWHVYIYYIRSVGWLAYKEGNEKRATWNRSLLTYGIYNAQALVETN